MDISQIFKNQTGIGTVITGYPHHHYGLLYCCQCNYLLKKIVRGMDHESKRAHRDCLFKWPQSGAPALLVDN